MPTIRKRNGKYQAQVRRETASSNQPHFTKNRTQKLGANILKRPFVLAGWPAEFLILEA